MVVGTYLKNSDNFRYNFWDLIELTPRAIPKIVPKNVPSFGDMYKLLFLVFFIVTF